MQRELRRQVRLSQSLKQQVKQLEETMRGLERRVEAQRRELKLNEQTMELMDQSRKLAEGKSNVDYFFNFYSSSLFQFVIFVTASFFHI